MRSGFGWLTFRLRLRSDGRLLLANAWEHSAVVRHSLIGRLWPLRECVRRAVVGCNVHVDGSLHEDLSHPRERGK